MWSIGQDLIIPALVSLLKQNQFVQVVVFGSISAYVCLLLNTFYRMFVLPLFTGMQCSIAIHNTDENFNAVMDFISDRLLQNISGSQYSLQANTKIKENKTSKEYMQEWLRGGNSEPHELVYRPDNDQVIHTITYKGCKIFIERAKSQPLMGRDKPFTPESLKLTTWGSDNTVLKALMSDAVVAASQQLREGTVNIYTLSSGWCSGWELALKKKARPKDSVILDMQDTDMMLDDARNFLQSGKWYVDMGIPYRRGYLLYGPPGCGKTSFAQVLAGELQLDICILNLTHSGLTDDGIAEHLRDAPHNSIIVLEDVDAIFVERTAAAKDGDNKRGGSTSVSFSGLLNALDGVASQEGRLLFMTTNHIERLDPALIRPGRCDVQLQLKLASKNQMERMFLRFYPGETSLARQFASSLPANELSMATLQGYFLKCTDSAQRCVDQTSDLLQSSRPSAPTTKSIYDHLKRVGLERYAALLEFHGITTDQDLASAKLDTLLTYSVELQFDPAAQRLFALLLDSDQNRTFMINSYTFAEVPQIREAFLAAYADVSNECLLKSVCAPLQRQYSNNSMAREDASENGYDVTDGALKLIDDDGANSAPDSARSGNSENYECSDPTSLSVDELRDLSKAFCNALSSGGKGIVSLYNLRRLIDAHPRRPHQCVRAAAAFTQPRNLHDQVVKHLDLYAFLKRLGLASKIHQFQSADTHLVGKLLEMSGSVPEITENARKTYSLNPESAFRLAEVVKKVTSESGNLINFALHPRTRIMNIFQLFYTAGAESFREYTSVARAGAPNESVDGDTDVADDSSSSGLTLVEVDSAVSNTSALHLEGLKDLQPVSPVELEKLAYQFGLITTDAQGTALVSLLEVLDHLRRHPTSPRAAVASARHELVNPPYPDEPVAAPSVEEPLEWVDEWLKSAPGSDLTQYAAKFKEQGFVTKEDFLVGPVLNTGDLSGYLNIPVLAHRRRIVDLHVKLRTEHGITQAY